MYTVILVDDEPLVLDTFANYVDWASMSAKVVGTARNGRDALQKVRELRPDILITDIKMPVSDGISLAGAVHEQFPEIQIVFLSGYNEFDYARSAIYLGVSAYLLKPLDHQELAETMQRVCARCEMEKNRKNASLPMAGEYLRELLQMGGLLLPGLADEVAGIFSASLGLPKENSSFYFTLISMDEYTTVTDSPLLADPDNSGDLTDHLETAIAELPGICPGILTKLWGGRWLFTSASHLFPDILRWRQSDPETARWISVFSLGPPADILSLTKRWPELLLVRKKLVARDGPGITADMVEGFTAAPQKGSLPSTDRLLTHLLEGKAEAVQQWLDEFYTFSAFAGDIRQVFQDTVSFYETVQAAVVEPNRNLNRLFGRDADFFGRLAGFESAGCIKASVRRALTLIMEELREKQGNRRSAITAEVCRIVRREYASPLSTDYLAEKVYLSPNYLSALFKEMTGKTLLEYITEVRLKAAADRLRDTNMKIHDIARAVGYESASYFSSLFYKNTGQTPNQYRLTAGGGCA